MFVGMYNIGLQAQGAIAACGVLPDAWQAGLFTMFGDFVPSRHIGPNAYGACFSTNICSDFCGQWFLGSVIRIG